MICEDFIVKKHEHSHCVNLQLIGEIWCCISKWHSPELAAPVERGNNTTLSHLCTSQSWAASGALCAIYTAQGASAAH